MHKAAPAGGCTTNSRILGLIWANRSVLSLAPGVTPPDMSGNPTIGCAAERKPSP